MDAYDAIYGFFWISWMHIYVFMDARMFVQVCVKGAMDGVLDGVRPV